MYRSRSAITYDFLHGIHPSSNISTIFAYLSYFPPPPPFILGPPARRSWTCSANPYSSCFISDDRNPPSLRQYIPIIKINQSYLSNNTSYIYNSTLPNFKPSSIIDFLRNHLTFILLLIIFLSIFIFVILLLILFLYIQRLRQRQLTSHSHIETNNNNIELNNNNKNPKFYYRLIPYRKKHSTTLRNQLDGNNLLRLSNHDSPVLEVKHLSKTSGFKINLKNEQEEAL